MHKRHLGRHGGKRGRKITELAGAYSTAVFAAGCCRKFNLPTQIRVVEEVKEQQNAAVLLVLKFHERSSSREDLGKQAGV